MEHHRRLIPGWLRKLRCEPVGCVRGIYFDANTPSDFQRALQVLYALRTVRPGEREQRQAVLGRGRVEWTQIASPTCCNCCIKVKRRPPGFEGTDETNG